MGRRAPYCLRVVKAGRLCVVCVRQEWGERGPGLGFGVKMRAALARLQFKTTTTIAAAGTCYALRLWWQSWWRGRRAPVCVGVVGLGEK